MATLAVSCLVSKRAWGAGEFKFSVPPGWVNVSRAAPEAERRRAPAELLALVDAGPFAFYALDIESGQGASVNAIVTAGTPPVITPALLEEQEQGIRREMEKQGWSYRTVRKELVKVAGVSAALVSGDVLGADGALRSSQYVVPGENATATLTFTSPAAAYERYRPVFEASVQAIRGAREPTSSGSPMTSAVVVSAIVGGAAAAAMAAKKAAASATKR